VRECKELLEYDSPIPSCTNVVACEEALFGSLSDEEAQYLIREKVKKHTVANPTLAISEGQVHQLVGEHPGYPWAHKLTITLETIAGMPTDLLLSRFLRPNILTDQPGSLRYALISGGFPFNPFYMTPQRDGGVTPFLWSPYYEARKAENASDDEAFVYVRAILDSISYNSREKILLMALFEDGPDEALQWLTTPLDEPKNLIGESLKEYPRGQTPLALLKDFRKHPYYELAMLELVEHRLHDWNQETAKRASHEVLFTKFAKELRLNPV